MGYRIEPLVQRNLFLKFKTRAVRQHIMQRKNISNLELKELKKQFPNLLDILSGKTEPTNILQPCSFDHYLTLAECDTIQDSAKDEERRASHKKMLELFFEASNKEVFSWRYKRKNRIQLYKVTDWNYLYKTSQIEKKTGLSGCGYFLISKKLNVIYEEHWDWTNILTLFSKSDLTTVKEITSKSGLFLLNPSEDQKRN